MYFSRISNSILSAIWIGISCASWTRARRAPAWSRMPKPLRGDDLHTIFGLENLNEADQARVDLGNKQLKWVCKVIAAAILHGTPIILENPGASRIWLAPNLKKLIDKSSSVILFHHCAYGAPWQKPTKLVGWNIDLQCLAKTCHVSSGVCQYSGAPHIVLSGKAGSGFKTAQASAYPFKFCKIFGSFIKSLALKDLKAC